MLEQDRGAQFGAIRGASVQFEVVRFARVRFGVLQANQV